MLESNCIERPRILLMCGDLAESAGHAALLTQAGWQTVQVGDTIEALSAVRSESIDLALLRMSVEDMVDMDLSNVVRRVSPWAYLPVMILTDTPAGRERCMLLDGGADDVICPETSPAETIARIRALLRIKKLHDQLAASRTALKLALQRERKLLAKLRRDNENLQAACTTDPLTRVQNVRSFREILAHEFRIAKRYDQSLSLLMLDVDHFKVVNDVHGHPSGDYVLKELAVIFKQSVRESDVVARVGGEEFAVILPKADAGQATRFAERIRTEVYSRQFLVYHQDIHVTISVGLACFPGDAEITEPEMLVYFADQALLMAKQSGRDQVVTVRQMPPTTRSRLRDQYHQQVLPGRPVRPPTAPALHHQT